MTTPPPTRLDMVSGTPTWRELAREAGEAAGSAQVRYARRKNQPVIDAPGVWGTPDHWREHMVEQDYIDGFTSGVRQEESR